MTENRQGELQAVKHAHCISFKAFFSEFLRSLARPLSPLGVYSARHGGTRSPIPLKYSRRVTPHKTSYMYLDVHTRGEGRRHVIFRLTPGGKNPWSRRLALLSSPSWQWNVTPGRARFDMSGGARRGRCLTLLGVLPVLTAQSGRRGHAIGGDGPLIPQHAHCSRGHWRVRLLGSLPPRVSVFPTHPPFLLVGLTPSRPPPPGGGHPVRASSAAREGQQSASAKLGLGECIHWRKIENWEGREGGGGLAGGEWKNGRGRRQQPSSRVIGSILAAWGAGIAQGSTLDPLFVSFTSALASGTWGDRQLPGQTPRPPGNAPNHPILLFPSSRPFHSPQNPRPHFSRLPHCIWQLLFTSSPHDLSLPAPQPRTRQVM